MRLACALLSYLGLLGWLVLPWGIAAAWWARRERIAVSADRARAALHLRIALRVVVQLREALVEVEAIMRRGA
jgi:hypothetical protein